MITLITLYIETSDILQDAPIFDLQRTLENKPQTTAFLHHYLSLALSQFMAWATDRAWDYHVRLVVINYTQPITGDCQPTSNSQLLTQNSIVKEPTMLYLPSVQTGNGKHLTVINGKTYNLIRAYHSNHCNGWVFFIVSGRIPLKPDDIAEHWIVTRQDNIYLARAARYFSYHLLKSTDTACPVSGWPKFKALPDHFAFIGPDKTAVEAQIASIIRQFVPSKTELIPYIISNAAWINEKVTKGDPKACIIKTEDLQ